MVDAITVSIAEVTSRTAPPASTLCYRVRNGSDRTIWMVNDHWLSWRQTDSHIELSFRRERMRAGAQVFGYFPPAVVAIKPGQERAEWVELVWPQPLDELWNSQSLAAPPPGTYGVAVRIGYGLSPAPSSPRSGADVEAVVLRWQEEAVSAEAPLTVPAYDRPGDACHE